jgi:hypothetical protein
MFLILHSQSEHQTWKQTCYFIEKAALSLDFLSVIEIPSPPHRTLSFTASRQHLVFDEESINFNTTESAAKQKEL